MANPFIKLKYGRYEFKGRLGRTDHGAGIKWGDIVDVVADVKPDEISLFNRNWVDYPRDAWDDLDGFMVKKGSNGLHYYMQPTGPIVAVATRSAAEEALNRDDHEKWRQGHHRHSKELYRTWDELPQAQKDRLAEIYATQRKELEAAPLEEEEKVDAVTFTVDIVPTTVHPLDATPAQWFTTTLDTGVTFGGGFATSPTTTTMSDSAKERVREAFRNMAEVAAQQRELPKHVKENIKHQTRKR